jgi:ABC-type lipoprotein export system ATPase subunit
MSSAATPNRTRSGNSCEQSLPPLPHGRDGDPRRGWRDFGSARRRIRCAPREFRLRQIFMLNLIAGLDRPTSASVIVHDRNLAQLSREELARYRLHTVGMVFQSFNLIAEHDAAENVELPMRFAEIERGSGTVWPGKRSPRVGLQTRMNHRPSELSGGEQQRAALARALINRPQLLLADEPTGNLDSHTGTEIMNMVREFNQQLGMTVVMVTHERRFGGALRPATYFPGGWQTG